MKEYGMINYMESEKGVVRREILKLDGTKKIRRMINFIFCLFVNLKFKFQSHQIILFVGSGLERYFSALERISKILSSYGIFDSILKQVFHVIESELGIINPAISILNFSSSLRPKEDEREEKEKKIARAPRKDIIDFHELKILVSPIRVEGRDLGFISGLSDDKDADIKLNFLSVVGTMIGFSFFILAREKADVKKVGNIIFRSRKMEEVIRIALEVAKSDATVLIRGESGVGKELIADLIHENSDRAGKQIVKINCAAIPENLLESELFGYKKGAFTGALYDKKGKFELAEGGTIFLDEIGDLSPSLQSKLLRVIQTKEIEPIGGTPKKVNVRIIAATNRNLEELVKEGKFREDLYYRLNVVPIFVPPLRERKEDIRPLVDFFLEKFNKKYGKNVSISKGVMVIFEEYDWPGNVRELENLLERLVITSSDLVITPDDLPDYIRDYVMKKKGGVNREEVFGGATSFDNVRDFGFKEILSIVGGKGNLSSVVQKIEKEAIEYVLSQSKNLSDAARKLGISRRQLEWRIKKYGISFTKKKKDM